MCAAAAARRAHRRAKNVHPPSPHRDALRTADRTAALSRDAVGYVGYVGLHRSEPERNVALIARAKTSVLVKTTERDAHVQDCSVTVIDPTRLLRRSRGRGGRSSAPGDPRSSRAVERWQDVSLDGVSRAAAADRGVAV
jgi:hypothetical protein